MLLSGETLAQVKVSFGLARAVSACTQEEYVLHPPFFETEGGSVEDSFFFLQGFCLYQGATKKFFSFVREGFKLYPRVFRRSYFFTGFSMDIVYADGSNQITIRPAPSSFPGVMRFVSYCYLEESPLFIRYAFKKKKVLRQTLKTCLKEHPLKELKDLELPIHYRILTKES